MKPYYEEHGITIYHGDCREGLPKEDLGMKSIIYKEYKIWWEKIGQHSIGGTTPYQVWAAAWRACDRKFLDIHKDAANNPDVQADRDFRDAEAHGRDPR
jgi:hypothetical protein